MRGHRLDLFINAWLLTAGVHQSVRAATDDEWWGLAHFALAILCFYLIGRSIYREVQAHLEVLRLDLHLIAQRQETLARSARFLKSMGLPPRSEEK